MKWLKALRSEGLYAEILEEYLLTYEALTDKLEGFDKRIEELATNETLRKMLESCPVLFGFKGATTLVLFTEVSDFKRFLLFSTLLPISDLHLEKIRTVTIRAAVGLPKPETVKFVLCW